MRIILCLLFAPIFTLSFHASAANISYVYDGDTVKINDNNTEYKLRLTDIDAPEHNQAYGKKSRRALIGLCSQANIHTVLSGTDKYNRRLGKLFCNGQDVSVWMVQNGHAWFNSRYSMDGTLQYAEQTARQNKLGLWKSKQQTPPWVWRKTIQTNVSHGIK